MDYLFQAGIFRELNENCDLKICFANLVIILPKKDYVTLVIDVRYLKSINDTSDSTWPLKPLINLLTKITRIIFTTNE